LYCTKVLAKKNLSAPSDISNVWHIPEQVLANTHTNNLNLFSLWSTNKKAFFSLAVKSISTCLIRVIIIQVRKNRQQNMGIQGSRNLTESLSSVL
ncbi:unnamed protein product, partial [Brassica napus]